MKSAFYIIWFCIIKLLLTNGALLAQDKIFLPDGDSVEAFIPGDPYKETGLNKKVLGSKGNYGFLQVMAIYPNDSVRIHTPEQIKGFRRAELGRYLGSGYFESRILDTKYIRYGKRSSLRPVFLHRVIEAHEYTMWHYRDATLDVAPDYYFLLEKKDHEGYKVFMTWKEWRQWAENTIPFSEIIKGIPPPKRKRSFTSNGFAYLQAVFSNYRDQYTAEGVFIKKQ